MARDAEATKRRIFEAANAEFAARGIAGARIDRIAKAASANKQLIYAYFGNKQELFDAVVTETVARFVEEVAFDAEDVPGFAVAAYDFFTKYPEIVHLASWHTLELAGREHDVEAISRSLEENTRKLRRAQRAGLVDSSIGAAELLALVISIALTWVHATPEIDHMGGDNPRVRARRRAAVREAVNRLV